MTVGPLRCFLFTDLEASTRAWEADAGEMAGRLEGHDRILLEVFARHGGRVFSTGGDGFAVVFDDVGGAVAAAVESHGALTTDGFKVRMGIHVGQAFERNDNYFGPTVNRTARLMAAGHGGQVLLSEAAAALFRPGLSEGLRLVDLGLHWLRDLNQPEHVWQLEPDGESRSFPPLRTVAATTNLPVTEPLIGRDGDVGRVVDLVRSHRLVTITGPGGVGKSRLALTVAQEVADDHRDGCWLVELAALDAPEGLIGTIAGVLPLAAVPTTASELLAQLAARRMLVVIDNCEHLIDGVATLVAQMLDGCPDVKVLCTSQEALGLDREYAWPLQPLAEDAAAALFDERSRAVRPELLDDRDTVAVIVGRLDRLPLAIELAAARVATFSPSEIAALLDDRFDLLSAGGRGRLPRHRGLAAMVQWSHELLEPEEQRLFRRLGVFAGGFTRDAAIQVTQDEHTNRTRLAIALDQLVRRSLVVADVGSGATRYRMLETLRHYALDRLAEADETDVVGRRHAEWCADLALGFEAVDSPDEALWLARGIAEFDNLRVAVGFAIDHHDTDLAVRLVGRLWRLRDLGRFELVDWARQVLMLPGAADHPDVGYVHTLVALLTFVTNEIDACGSASEEALQRPLDEDAWTRVCVMKTSVLMIRDKWKESGIVFRHAVETVRRPQNRVRLRGNAASGEAWMRRPMGIDADRLVADADATRIPGLQAHVRCMLAQTRIAQDRALDAVRLAAECLQILQPGFNRRMVNSANEIFALAAGRGSDEQTTDDVSGLAARALDLSAEHPNTMSFILVGLIVAADRDGHDDLASLLAGYLSTHLAELALPARSAENFLRGPLDRFVTAETRALYERGETMTEADLRVELERLARGVRQHPH